MVVTLRTSGVRMSVTKAKILIVDDEEGIRKVLRISLSDTGYKVYTAQNGDQALEIFREIHPAIVLTDIKMPGITGIELLRIIKKEVPDTEVIMISGHGDMDLAIESLKSEATDFITKPINDDTLDIALKRANERIVMRQQLRGYTENLETLVKEQSEKLIEAERAAAISKTFEGLSSTIWNLFGDVEGDVTYFNEMPCLVSIHDRESKVVAVNQLYVERLGDRKGKNSWDIYKGDTKSQDLCPVGRTLETGKSIKTKETIYYSNNTEAPVNVHTAPIRNTQGEIELVLEISMDMSEVNQLKQALQSTQENYQQLFDTVPCYITVQDRDFQLTAANQRFKDDFYYSPDTHCYKAYKHRDHPCPDCPVEKTFQDGKSHSSEMVVTSVSGEQYHVLIWTAPMRNKEGGIFQVMEMSTNITQIRELQDHLSSLGLKIGSISHGIKGLLTGLDGGMYLLDSGFTEENKNLITEGWDIVKHKISRIRSMVLDILHFAKERELNLEQVTIADFINEVVSYINPKIISHGIRFVLDVDPLVGEFEVDPGFIQAAFINILENAIDACVEDKSNRAHKITFGVQEHHDQVMFEISDNGIGMDRETQENLFTLFYSTKGTKGTGFGLFVAHQIIKQHEGSIQVTSDKGKGSLFQIYLPRKQQKP